MNLKAAELLAQEVVGRLGPHCERIHIAGSVRRKKPWVNDIDLVLIPTDPWELAHEVRKLGPFRVSGEKLQRVSYGGIQIDLYYAKPETWATLLLIRTGSKESNIRLCSRAQLQGWRLHANGDGLFNEKGERIAGETEESIYEALGLPYRDPPGRD